jgi:hypothetical protein
MNASMQSIKCWLATTQRFTRRIMNSNLKWLDRVKGGAILDQSTHQPTSVTSLRSRGLARAGVKSSLPFAATLVCALAFGRPVEAREFHCETKNAGCLVNAITAANENGQENTIYLGARTYQLTIPLPDVTSPRWLTIQGMGAGLTSISGTCTEALKDARTKECSTGIREFSVFKVAPTGALWLIGVTVKNGQAGSGAGIWNDGSLMVYGSTIKSNHAHGYGGGIYNKGWTYLQDSTVLNNVVHNGRGGGIFNSGGQVDIAYSTINGNKTWNGSGAGIANGNLDPASGQKSGGGLNIFNSTISGNSFLPKGSNISDRANAGGILNDGDGEVWLKSVTITTNADPYNPFNNYPRAGGVYNRGKYFVDGTLFAESKFYFANTIIAVNVGGGDTPSTGAPSDCRGQLFTLGGNLVGSAVGTDRPCKLEVPPWNPDWPSRPTDQTNIDPQFKTGLDRFGYPIPLLADNGGTSCTHALLKGSPAVDNAWTGRPGEHPFACETYDQRWVTRDSAENVSGAGCDVGAFERRSVVPPSGLGCTE